MKRKYLMIVISIIAAIAIGIISLPFLRKTKSRYEYSVMMKNINKSFEEMITFCEENQSEIEAYSSQYLTMKHPDMSYEELGKLESQIAEELDCKWIFEKISVGNTGKMNGEEDAILYQYKHFDHIDYEGVNTCRSIEIYYIEKEISQEEFENMYFFTDPYFLRAVKKINDHLYVCVTGYMCL